MELYYHQRFKKQHKKLALRTRKKVDRVILLFLNNPHDPRLRNHSLRGAFSGERAISVTGDVRVIFREEGNYKKVTFLQVGTHNQVYGK